MTPQANLPFDNTYAQLPARFFARQRPTPVSAPKLIRANRQLAAHLGIDPDFFSTAAGVEVVAGNCIPAGANPILTPGAGAFVDFMRPCWGDRIG